MCACVGESIKLVVKATVSTPSSLWGGIVGNVEQYGFQNREVRRTVGYVEVTSGRHARKGRVASETLEGYAVAPSVQPLRTHRVQAASHLLGQHLQLVLYA